MSHPLGVENRPIAFGFRSTAFVDAPEKLWAQDIYIHHRRTPQGYPVIGVCHVYYPRAWTEEQFKAWVHSLEPWLREVKLYPGACTAITLGTTVF